MTFSELILLFTSNVGIICKGKFTLKSFLKSALSMPICHFERLIHIKYKLKDTAIESIHFYSPTIENLPQIP